MKMKSYRQMLLVMAATLLVAGCGLAPEPTKTAEDMDQSPDLVLNNDNWPINEANDALTIDLNQLGQYLTGDDEATSQATDSSNVQPVDSSLETQTDELVTQGQGGTTPIPQELKKWGCKRWVTVTANRKLPTILNIIDHNFKITYMLIRISDSESNGKFSANYRPYSARKWITKSVKPYVADADCNKAINQLPLQGNERRNWFFPQSHVSSGHLMAQSMGGVPLRFNMAPQFDKMNNAYMNQVEQTIKRCENRSDQELKIFYDVMTTYGGISGATVPAKYQVHIQFRRKGLSQAMYLRNAILNIGVPAAVLTRLMTQKGAYYRDPNSYTQLLFLGTLQYTLSGFFTLSTHEAKDDVFMPFIFDFPNINELGMPQYNDEFQTWLVKHNALVTKLREFVAKVC
jgi:hypothetical protein